MQQEVGADNDTPGLGDAAARRSTPWAGEKIRIVFEAADLGRASMVEAAVDDVRITRRQSGQALGQLTVNVAPLPGVDVTEIVPPWASTSPRAIARPSPDRVTRRP